jgi:hypothetical protein
MMPWHTIVSLIILFYVGSLFLFCLIFGRSWHDEV